MYVTIPAGNASITAGGWANFDLGKYDNSSDISESGGTSAFNFAEFDPWVEVGIPVGRATLTPGVTAYIYPNSAGLTSDFNTVEVYLKAALDAPLSPKVNVYYDVDKVKGLYAEGSISHSLAASEKVSINLSAVEELPREFIEKHKFYQYGRDPHTGQVRVVLDGHTWRVPPASTLPTPWSIEKLPVLTMPSSRLQPSLLVNWKYRSA